MSDVKKEGSVLSIVKDTLALVIITLVAAVLLGFVREITAEPIAKRAEEDKQKAYLAVFESASSVVESKDVPELKAALGEAGKILTPNYADVTVFVTQLFANLQAVNTRHHNVKDGNIKVAAVFFVFLQSCFAAVCLYNFISCTTQVDNHKVADCGFVFTYKDFFHTITSVQIVRLFRLICCWLV